MSNPQRKRSLVAGLPVRPQVGLVSALALAGLFGAWLCAGRSALLAAEPASQPGVETPSPSPSDLPPQAEQPPAQAEQAAPAAGACCAPKTCRPRHHRGCRVRLRRHCGPCCSPGDAPQADPYAWKDLFDGKTLDGWKVPNFGGQGEVKVKDGMVIMETGNMMTGITYTGEVPRENYEIYLEGMRLEGSDFFCTTTFPVGKDPCTLVVGGWGGTVVGLSNVDFYDASDNPTTTFMDFKDNRWYKVRLRVSSAKIEAWIDDQQVVNQVREGHKFDIRFEVELCQPLGISTWCTTGAVRNIRIRPLRPEEIKAAEESAREMIKAASVY